MPITYPLTWPASPEPNEARLTEVSVVGIGRSAFTRHEQIQPHQGQGIEAELRYPPLTEAEFRTLQTMRRKLNGPEGTFLMAWPGLGTLGTVTGTPVVNGAGQTGTDIAVRGLTPNSTGNLVAGDPLQLGAGLAARMHVVLDDVDADGSGNATISVWPQVKAAQPLFAGQAIVTASPVGLWRLTSGQMAWDKQVAQQYGLVVACHTVV